ncbi:capsule biosynthesis protein CapK [Duganella sp. Leaf126]|uniref:AMP-binding protein n=1 Tax=Duganella sp. Leaf126 TaxID=1736266 RepID=UPI0006FA0F0D|nr:AMP-binding protein [Duganella sp. Leaf126]KQQ31878.1 capsule biosynthesis protein CapK [Duganella sp. Leaf126]
MNSRANLRDDEHERFPTLTAAGRAMLDFLQEHPAAPTYRNHSGNKLLAHEVEQVRRFEQQVADADVGWPAGGRPAWLDDFVRATYASVPHYRASGAVPAQWSQIAPVSRADLAADIAAFVPDHADIARMINFRTTGTTGHPLVIASHPVVAARYLAFHKRALRRFGVTLTHGAGQVGVVLLGFQQRCFTYVSVTPTMGESGLAKINLHPDEWRTPQDRAAYLDALAPEVVAGDPISFTELLALPVTMRPRALLSVSMLLLPALRAQLEARFGCPVLDLYSLNEVGPVAVYDARAGGHVLLQPQLYVELLDADGHPVAQGERGEITVSGGFNFCLPLLRYRTGDHASLALRREGAVAVPVLVGLSGRSPVRYRTPGRWINNIDVTHALQHLPIPHFGVHQQADGKVVLRLAQAMSPLGDQARAALETLFGAGSVTLAVLGADDKTVQYTSDLAGARA